VVDPESRAKLSELLRRTFFRPKATAEMKQITLLGLFCCPRFLPDGITPVPRLNLDREMREAVCALPWGERELYTAARFPQVRYREGGEGGGTGRGVHRRGSVVFPPPLPMPRTKPRIATQCPSTRTAIHACTFASGLAHALTHTGTRVRAHNAHAHIFV
jgi:hypothetical protein